MALKKPEHHENFFIMGGHFADDLCQGAFPAVLAFMYQEGRLNSYAEVAFLLMATTIVNAVVQPLTGYIADKKPRPYLMCLGMLLAGIGLMFLGFVENFYIMVAMAAVNGIGVAGFHPAAGKLANIFSGRKMGRGMSIFQVGGNIGYALGPLYFTAFYMLLGLKATLLIVVPGLFMTIFFVARNRKYNVFSKRDHQKRTHKKGAEGLVDNYTGTLLLLVLVFLRSAAMFSLIAFLPLYYMHVLNVAEEFSTITITAIGVAGAFATLAGGFFADRFGFTQWVRLASAAAVPFAVLSLFTINPVTILLCLTLYGIFYYGAMSSITIIGQKLLPLHVGMATGITIGLGISFGGITAPFLGSIGDAFGLEATMKVIVCLVAAGGLCSFLVPVVERTPKGT